MVACVEINPYVISCQTDHLIIDDTITLELSARGHANIITIKTGHRYTVVGLNTTSNNEPQYRQELLNEERPTHKLRFGNIPVIAITHIPT